MTGATDMPPDVKARLDVITDALAPLLSTPLFKPEDVEVGWLIEKLDSTGNPTGLCAGECSGKLVWTTPSRAIRYARQCDGKASARLHGLSGVDITEHSWG